MKLIENILLGSTMWCRTTGPLKLDKGLFKLFLSLPENPLPDFQGAVPGLRGRGKDHPRYSRWMHAFVKFYKPAIAVEIGTNAGGTAIGIARALKENRNGRLICIDNGEGVPRSFPDIARKNILATGLGSDRLELLCGDSRLLLPNLASELRGQVGVCLVDAAHMYEAALNDIENSIPMMKKEDGYILVHDVDFNLNLGNEASLEHPHPVLGAFQKVVRDNRFGWCILKFIRKHLGIMQVNR